ncbi:MAG TPA: hypothetical protein VEI57_11055 [Nitrospirota bacterium]|nr:hypothetical protein [Nitrospirota bacterium]
MNEAETVGVCIQRAQRLLKDNNIDGEVLISDNGSIDGSTKIARDHGARGEVPGEGLRRRAPVRARER